MTNVLSQEAFTYALEASKYRPKYIEAQAALWVILSEQGEKEAAEAVNSEMNDICERKEWTEQREQLLFALSDIREKKEEFFTKTTPRIKRQLARYDANPLHWWSACNLLHAEAAEQLSTYQDWLAAAIVEESPKCTPFMIQQNLNKMNLPTPLSAIERLLVERGLITKRPESEHTVEPEEPPPKVEPKKKGELCGACRWIKAKFTKTKAPEEHTGLSRDLGPLDQNLWDPRQNRI